MATERPFETTRRIRYILVIWGGTFELASVEGQEAISTTSRFDVSLTTTDPELFDPESLAGESAVLRIDAEGADLRWIPVVVTSATIGATSRGAPEVRMVLEPKLALLRHRSDARVFVDRTVPEIVGEVLNEGSIPWQARLRETYRKRPFTVQYRETDLAFLSRLLEEEGIHYFFLDDGNATMVLGDSPAAYETMLGEDLGPSRAPPPLRFQADAGMERKKEVVFSLRRRASLAPSAISLRDWNPERPSLDMDVTAPGPTAAGAPYYDFPRATARASRPGGRSRSRAAPPPRRTAPTW
jgi:type VI secretion system secreted protein VgrG